MEVYVDDCLVARVDSQGGDFGTHPGETHRVSLDEGTHTIEYRNVFSIVGSSGWIVGTTLQSFTGNFFPCDIKEVKVVCRPLKATSDFNVEPKAGKHCYFLVEDFNGNKSTYSAFPDINNNLTPLFNGDPTDPPGECGGVIVGILESWCRTVDPPSGKTLESIVEHLDQTVANGSEGTYNNITNNSNLWVERRINELNIDINLPASAVTSKSDVIIRLPLIIPELIACGINEAFIQRILEALETGS